MNHSVLRDSVIHQFLFLIREACTLIDEVYLARRDLGIFGDFVTEACNRVIDTTLDLRLDPGRMVQDVYVDFSL